MSKILRNLLLVLACLIGSQTAMASPFGLHFLHKGPPPSGLANSYDPRFGTGNVTVNGTPGWFSFPLHSGNRAIYADSSNGSASDSNACTSAALPCATIDGAFNKFSTGFTAGDHLRIAGTGGRTYTATLTTPTMACKDGISAAYPVVIESYDPADPTNTAKYGKLTGANQPVIKIGGARPDLGAEFQNVGCGGPDNDVAFQGITFDGQDGDGPGITWQGYADIDIVFQNDRFIGLQLTMNSGATYDATGATYAQAGNISKSAFSGGYASNSNMQCAYIHGTFNYYLQDNVWSHCGWRVGSSRDDTNANGGPAPTNHAHYIGATNLGIHVDRGTYTDSSADGVNVRTNADITSIASLDEPIAGNIGAFSNSPHEAPTGIISHTTDWVIAGGADVATSQPYGQGPWTTNTVGDSFIRNVAAFDNPKYLSGTDAFLHVYNGNQCNIGTLTHSGTTATLTCATGEHLYVLGGVALVTGDHIYLTGASPSAYNVSNASITVINDHTLSYTMLSTPATDATVVGSYTPQVPQQLLVDKVHTYHAYSVFDAGISAVSSIVTNTYTNFISDALAPGGGNSVSNGSSFPGYQTRDQVITTVLNGVGITPAATSYQRKAQLINAEQTRPDLPWSQWLIGVAFPAMGLTPTYTTPAYITFTDTPVTVYATSLSNLTISSTTFVHGVSKTVLLSGVSALPVLTASGLPSGCSISGRSITCNAVSAGTPSVTVHETTQDGSLTHDTVFTFTIS